MSKVLEAQKPGDLKNSQQIAKCINDALETRDAALVIKVIGETIRAQGSSEFSRRSRLERASLYRSFSGRMSPGFERVMNVLLALDIELVAKPVSKSKLQRTRTPRQTR